MDVARQKRREDINKSLTFIQSSLAFPEPESYQDFLTKLVCNLLEEGNAFFRDREWEQAVREFSEGLNVSQYAAAEDHHIPKALLESLYANRAAVFHSMGEYDRAVEDCDSALKVCEESCEALYRKALCLKELGKYREAYNCITDCLLITRLDNQVNELAQELAVHLGLKNRKPYVTARVSGINSRNGVDPLNHLAPGVNSHLSPHQNCSGLITQATPSASSTVPDMDTLEDTEVMGEDLDSLLDCIPNEQVPAETQTPAALSVPRRTSPCSQTVPSVLPAPTPQLPPAFFNSAVSQLNSLDSFSGAGRTTRASTLDTLDDLSTSGIGSAFVTPNSGLSSAALDDLDSLDDILNVTPGVAAGPSVNEPITEPDAGKRSDLGGEVPKIGVNAVDQLDSLDVLDSFPSVDGIRTALPAVSFGGTGLDSFSSFATAGKRSTYRITAPVVRPKKNIRERNNQVQGAASNPLSSTHEFLQACCDCFPRTGQGIYTYVHKPDLVHSCKRDILLCRRKSNYPSEWTRVRPLPKWTSFNGPFVLCKELLKSGDLGVCKFGEKCTFAYNQLEIDVWTEERKGTLDRYQLFETAAFTQDPATSIIRLLQEHKGQFMFLCQECYDNKPQIISNRCRENPTTCSNLDALHTFDANKCLAFVVRTHSVSYRKVRPFSVQCQLDLCRQFIRYGCQREDSCLYAHSVIELKTWTVQQDTGISPDEIVKVSMKYYDKPDQNSNKQKGNRPLYPGAGGSKPRGDAGKNLNLKMKFACGFCWRDGLISEPDKTLKHCSAKARHAWTKERWVLLVKSVERSKWVQVRPLPHAKNFPLQYDICTQILEKRKCNYTGKCTFAHSQEEKEMWMYMKNNELLDMQQMYDMWLALAAQSRQTEGSMLAQPAPEDKYIAMPTDYAEPMTGLHCRLCGKHSNSERQWQQHVSSEKHKDRVFSCEGEDEALTWSYRFPGRCFDLCPKLNGGCPDGASCDYAHSPEELQEWIERRDFLRHKLAKAREDMLIMPEESDFGKFNFLLQD